MTSANTSLGLLWGQSTTAAIITGAGSSSNPIPNDETDKNFFGYWLTNAATSGTTRGEYLRLYLTGGAGGEALRAFTTNSSNTPADTVNGAHISLSHGASAGNVTGLGTALRATYSVPNRSLGGTNAGVMSEFFADGASSADGGTASFLRAVLSGNATGLAAIEDTVNLIEVAGGTNASGNVVGAAGNEPTWTGKTHLVRCKLNGTTAYLVAITL